MVVPSVLWVLPQLSFQWAHALNTSNAVAMFTSTWTIHIHRLPLFAAQKPYRIHHSRIHLVNPTIHRDGKLFAQALLRFYHLSSFLVTLLALAVKQGNQQWSQRLYSSTRIARAFYRTM